MTQSKQNTPDLPKQDSEKYTKVWPPTDDYYSDKIYVSESGQLRIDCGGYVIEKPLRGWHDLATEPRAAEAVGGDASGKLENREGVIEVKPNAHLFCPKAAEEYYSTKNTSDGHTTANILGWLSDVIEHRQSCREERPSADDDAYNVLEDEYYAAIESALRVGVDAKEVGRVRAVIEDWHRWAGSADSEQRNPDLLHCLKDLKAALLSQAQGDK